MSDGKEVKLRTTPPRNCQYLTWCNYCEEAVSHEQGSCAGCASLDLIYFIQESDHERLMAELRAELFAVNHKLTKHRAANKILEAAIARRAKVIEKLKATIKDCLELGVSALNRGNWKEGEPLLRKSWVTLQELEAIEKEGAKDE